MKYCGIKIIDDQHEQLMRAIAEARAAFNDTGDFCVLLKLLKAARHYAIVHFKTEESVMMRFKYFDASNHKKVHDSFIEVVNKAVDNFEKEGIVSDTLLTFLEKWLLEHVDVEAELFAKHFDVNNINVDSLEQIGV